MSSAPSIGLAAPGFGSKVIKETAAEPKAVTNASIMPATCPCGWEMPNVTSTAPDHGPITPLAVIWEFETQLTLAILEGRIYIGAFNGKLYYLG